MRPPPTAEDKELGDQREEGREDDRVRDADLLGRPSFGQIRKAEGISVMRHNELSVLIGSQSKMDQLRRQDAETYAMSKAGQGRGLEGSCSR